MKNGTCKRQQPPHPVERMAEIDRLTEVELEAMAPNDLGQVRGLLLERLERDLKKTFAALDEN